MTENLTINAVEDKVTTAGKSYVRTSTEKGWLACFDGDSCKLLKDNVGKVMVVELKSSVANKGTPQEKVFQNIAKVLGEAQGNMANGEEDIIPVVKMNTRTGRNDTFHTAYAKDLCIAIIDKADKGEVAFKDIMATSIELVQMAKDAFE